MNLKGFILVKSFLTPYECFNVSKILCDKYKNSTLFYEGNDSHYKNSFGGNCDYFEQLLNSKTEFVKNLTGMYNLTKENSYGRIYFNGGKLLPHVDRQGLDITASISIDGNLDSEWELHLEDLQKNVHSVQIKPGDAIVFYGTRCKHWRNELHCESTQWTSKLFLHWSITPVV